MWRFCTYKPEETHRFGRILGQFAPAGLCIALTGELGAGKTLFSQGMAEGLEVEEQVTSPTFTIADQYFSGRLPFVHMDLYRLADADEAWERGIYEYFDGEAVVLVEWPQIMLDDLPEDRLDIDIKRRLDDDGAEWREIEITVHGEHKWLEEALAYGENLIS
ncbi:MAG: tRNA (adenosine(37)-N6)-threonylcarbamoyltransferase complex ATPase subunit type 1 TsaE [Firmicutes bacterium]|nr:tRNA (adenosine(37)-N6)-threonylcarbamoyltransferase complex ATPase subunit type 1 TsaE [Bacillota bacterium]